MSTCSFFHTKRLLGNVPSCFVYLQQMYERQERLNEREGFEQEIDDGAEEEESLETLEEVAALNVEQDNEFATGSKGRHRR